MGKMQRGLVAIFILAVLLLGYLAYRQWAGGSTLPDGLIQANGRIEGDQITIASKIAGRVVRMMVREGDAVTEGQPLIQLDDAQISAKVNQARAAVNVLEAQVRAAQTALEVLKMEVPLGVDAAAATVTQARAEQDKAEAAEQQARRDAQRFRELLERGTVNRQRSEQADLVLTMAKNDLIASRQALTRAEKQHAEARLGWDRIKAKEDELRALQAQQQQAEAVLAEAESVLADLGIAAPGNGVIMTRVREPGEVITAGAPLYDMVDLDQLYLKVYVPEAQIGKLRLGLPARVYTDAFPDLPYAATVLYIASRAEFTPKEVQTPDERVKLVYAVKLYLDANPEHRLTPGLPADAVIRWKEDMEWTKPRW